MKKVEKYFSKHVYMNSFSHIFVGLGLGVLFTNGWFNPHPLRWATIFLVLGGLGHLKAYMAKN